jgi:hypothetical protein
MAVYGNNSLAVRFQRNEVPEDKTEKVLTEMPLDRPCSADYTPGVRTPHYQAAAVPDHATYRGGRGFSRSKRLIASGRRIDLLA